LVSLQEEYAKGDIILVIYLRDPAEAESLLASLGMIRRMLSFKGRREKGLVEMKRATDE
jgi:hypothetical protein|tara:strand:- start:6159 stop:6335 length:177 start_codon:yes stop_codon:yes gene_type:complete